MRDYTIAHLNLVSTPSSLTPDEHAAVKLGSARRYVAAYTRILFETDLVADDPVTAKLHAFVGQQFAYLA